MSAITPLSVNGEGSGAGLSSSIFSFFLFHPFRGIFDEIPFPGVTPFGLTPGCNISPLQGDYNAIISFPALILNVNHY